VEMRRKSQINDALKLRLDDTSDVTRCNASSDYDECHNYDGNVERVCEDRWATNCDYE